MAEDTYGFLFNIPNLKEPRISNSLWIDQVCRGKTHYLYVPQTQAPVSFPHRTCNCSIIPLPYPFQLIQILLHSFIQDSVKFYTFPAFCPDLF